MHGRSGTEASSWGVGRFTRFDMAYFDYPIFEVIDYWVVPWPPHRASALPCA
jgi:hypothetical protein